MSLGHIKWSNCLRFVGMGDGFLNSIHTPSVPGVFYKPGNGDRFYPVFPRAQVLMIRHWNKNGVCYALNRTHFPHARLILFEGHPCEFEVVCRFPDALWITPQYSHRFFSDIRNHKDVSIETFNRWDQLFQKKAICVEADSCDTEPEKAFFLRNVSILQKE